VTDQPRRSWPINVRLGAPADRDAIVAFSSDTWDGYDYIPQVIDEWLVPSDGIVLVATVGDAGGGPAAVDANGEALAPGTVIATTRVTMLSSDEAWLEGIRVDPRVRGMEVASDLQVAELQWIEAHRARVVRYITSEVNTGSLKLGARHGLVEIGRWRSRGRHDDHDEDASARSAAQIEQELAGVGRSGLADWSWVSEDRAFTAAHGLYEYRGWAFQELTEERFARHLARREVYRAFGEDGSRAFVIVNRDELGQGNVHVALLAGGGTAAIKLLAKLGYPELRLPDPPPRSLAAIEPELAAAGLTPWSHQAVVVERRMDADHPLPAVDPARLVLQDVPRTIAKPRALE
jgi:hypothetical protein